YDLALKLLKEGATIDISAIAKRPVGKVGYDETGGQLKNAGVKYEYERDLVSKIHTIDIDKFGGQLKKFAEKYKENKETYEKIAEKTNIPPQLIAALHYRESSGNFKTYLHNGEPLGQTTTKVPAGIYFDNFIDAAVDAIQRQIKSKGNTFGLTADSNDIVAMLTFAEQYNGWGYYNKDVVSPYVYSGTNVYTSGKYTSDGVYNPSVKDKQPGVYIMLKSLEATVSGSGSESPSSTDSDNGNEPSNPIDSPNNQSSPNQSPLQKKIDAFLSVAEKELEKGFVEAKNSPDSKEGNNMTPYGKWYGLNGQPWCAMFVSWIADQAGVLGTEVPKFARVTDGVQWFKDKDSYMTRSSDYKPNAGDVIFFKNTSGQHHVGIVTGYDLKEGVVYTIEGNTSDAVKRRKYYLSDPYILGYGVTGGSGYGSTDADATFGSRHRNR
ncbi:CHAP domain-containing protein, partial [Paenibacillus turpanensis]|uniref:CHAP domain-containing protein n=1 Tax=Paenibacillus turpanensis TaxID=2689078 RepID=UPI00140A9F22